LGGHDWKPLDVNSISAGGIMPYAFYGIWTKVGLELKEDMDDSQIARLGDNHGLIQSNQEVHMRATENESGECNYEGNQALGLPAARSPNSDATQTKQKQEQEQKEH
jgi:hypothetical protein